MRRITNNAKVYIFAKPTKLSLSAILCASCLLLTPAYTYSAAASSSNLYDLSLEELGQVQVTLVAKKKQRVIDAAGSIYVITHEAIRRSGARTLPEALRLAPNLHVAQIKGNQYAISARGFNSSTANKLLVMIDGRIVYTPLYSGVFWDAQDVMLQDVEQIEIVSGPGGTLWGANAVNGVINIITKAATDTTGNLLHATSSNKERGVAVRHGGNFSNNRGSYRVYAKVDQWAHSVRASGMAEPDAWDRSQVGFRSDWRDQRNDVKVIANSYRNAIDQRAPGQETNSGTNLLARWKRTLRDGSSLRLLTYIDHSTHNTPGVYGEKLDIVNIDAQHSLPEADGNQLIWGGGYRVANDNVSNSDLLAFLPAERQLHWANLFVQQEQTLWPDWRLTLGARVESNDYTHAEFLPSAKLAWKLSQHQLLWASVARAVRAPSRVDTDLYAPATPPYLLAGGPDFRSEIANTMELGWRAQVGEALGYSLVVYHTEYDHLRSVETQADGAIIFGNRLEGRSRGVEGLVNYKMTHAWLLEISALTMDQHLIGTELAKRLQGNDPRSQWALSSKWNLSDSQQCGLSLRHVGRLTSPAVPSYTSLDAHFTWSPLSTMDLTLTGRSLNDSRHQEFATGSGAQLLDPIQVEREIDLAITVKF